MKPVNVVLAGVLLLVLTACGNRVPAATEPDRNIMGLLKVTISGIGGESSPTATAEWVQPTGELRGQAATVVSVNGTSALNDVHFIRRAVSFYDNDTAGTRNVLATFDLVNRTTINFNNFTLYAVNKSGVSIGGTGIAAMTSGTGAAITTAAIARGFKPTHGMRSSVNRLVVNEDIADLQFFTPSEVDSSPNGIKQQAITRGILTASDTVLEYGFVARNYDSARPINARNTGTDCTSNACKGTVTLAYQLPKVTPRQNNPFSFSLYFVVANETTSIYSQSLEEQSASTVNGSPSSFFASYDQVRILAGSRVSYIDGLNNLCRVKYAVTPNLYLGPDPIPSGPSGSLDVCFGASGRRRTNFGLDSSAQAVAIGSDGKIVVAGTRSLARYTSNGSLDTTFSGDGKMLIDFSSTALALQSDGKIVVAGYTSSDFAIVRYTSNGSLDTTFDTDGVVTTDFGTSTDEAYGVAIQSDGKIVVAGTSTSSTTAEDFALARYNSNGSLDTTFDGDGKVTTDIFLSFDFARAVAIQADGKIVVAGYTRISPDADFAVVRYNSNGSLDTSFGSGGKVVTEFNAGNPFNSTNVYALALQSDGKIVVVGDTYDGNTGFKDFALVRYTSNGFLDTSFDTDGKVTTGFSSGDDIAYAVAVQSNGKIVVAGTSSTVIRDFALARYNSNGSLDTTFDTDGKVTTDFDATTNLAYALAIQSDGKIVVVGENLGDFALVRYNP
jgi:uncharacterized delta-60 repeat protein